MTGDPLHSLTGTRDNAGTLHRVTGLGHVPLTVPRRIGEILREPVLLGAAGGGVLSLLSAAVPRGAGGGGRRARARRRSASSAAAGLPILGRYLLLPASILAIFAAAGVLGWLALDRDDPHRRPWQAFGALTVVALIAFAPGQVTRIRQERDALRIQEGIQSDLAALVGHGRLADACRPVTVPNRRPIPLLALWLGERPTTIRSAQDGPPRRGADLVTATPQVAHDYILDPRDLDRRLPPPPAGFAVQARNASWILLTRGCGADG